MDGNHFQEEGRVPYHRMVTLTPGQGRRLAASVLLGLFVLAVFAPLAGHPFLDLDDDSYVTRNPHVASGVGWDNLVWALTSFHSSNWHPLTWMSHQVDVSLWGLNPYGHHMTSVVLHVANVLLVVFVFTRSTGAFWPSLLAAALFGLHPQRLESVAWVAERKDVLSALFGLGTLAAWALYAERPAWTRYAVCLLAFTLGLSAKPMLVTLPVVLVLFSIWPLRRQPRAYELLPFFALSALSAVVTVFAQHAGGSIDTFAAVPFPARIENALVAYVVYLVKMLWPARLALVYPFPKIIPVWEWVGAGALLIALTALAVAAVKRRPWLTVGWLWYVVMLVPVIGLVQVGTQAYADRYTYLPLLGIDVAIAWSAAELAAARPKLRDLLIAGGFAAAVALAGMTVWQGRFWTSSERLFARSLAVAPESALVHNNFGTVLQRRGKLDEAMQHFRAALTIDPYDANTRKNLGNVLLDLHRPAEAVEVLQRLAHDKPEFAGGRNRLGVALAMAGRPEEGLPHLRRAVELAPDDARWREDLVVALLMGHREGEALPLLEAVVAKSEATAEDHYLLGVARAQQGQLDAAATAFEAAISMNPRHARALNQLGIARARQGRRDDAVALFRRSLAIDPAFQDARFNLEQAEKKGTLPF